MNIPYLMMALLLPGGVDAPQTNQPHGTFIVQHIPGDELHNRKLTKCEYGDGSDCLFMNHDMLVHPVELKFRFDPQNVTLNEVDDNAEYIAWIQTNSNACHYADNDPAVHFLGRAPYKVGRGRFVGVSGVSAMDAHRIEMTSGVIMNLTRDATKQSNDNLKVATWQLCMGIDPQHGAVIEGDKHPVGGLPFYIGTDQPEAPALAGVSGFHQTISATVHLPEVLREDVAAIGLRAIPTDFAAAQDHDAFDASELPPASAFACPAWGMSSDLLLQTELKDEIIVKDPKYDAVIDKNDQSMHLTLKLHTPPGEPYVVCAYARDRVNNISEFSAPQVARSYQASDVFTALPEAWHLDHGCNGIALAPWQCAAAAAAWGMARLRRRGRQKPT